MGLANMKSVLIPAMEGGYAVPAFNVCNLEYIKIVIQTAERLHSPVIIALHPVEIEYAGLEEISNMVRIAAQNADVPVVLHLDHGDTYERAAKCIVNGFTSVMYDGSHEPFHENVKTTAMIVKLAHAVNVSVEAELGLVGGAEGSKYAHNHGLDAAQLTSPSEVVEFAAQTGIDSLAVAIGSAHGLYTGEPHIDIERLREIRRCTDIPLVLHGGSGLCDTIIRECIENGISKINIATELKIAYHQGMIHSVEKDSREYDPRVTFQYAMEEAARLIESKINLFGSRDRV